MLAKLVIRMDQARFHNIVVCMLPEGPLAEPIRAAGIPVYSLGMRRGIPSPLALIRLYHLLQRERPDVLQTWLYHADLLGFVAGKLSGVEKIIWNLRCSNVELQHYRRLAGWTIRACTLLSKFPDAVITNSYIAKDFHLTLGYRPKCFEVIPNGFDLDRFQPNEADRVKVMQELGIDIDTPVIGMIARFDHMKGHQVFCNAAGILHKMRPKIHFFLCGNGIISDNSQLITWIKENKIEDVTHLLGERSNIQRILAAIDIYVSSSYGEGFPNIVGEAMACGVPCVVTDVGDSARIVGNTGIVVPPKNPRAVADGILHLLAMSEQEREALGIAARKRISSMFSIDGIVRHYEKLYFKLVNSSLKAKDVLQQ